jgi:hypothetical protein
MPVACPFTVKKSSFCAGPCASSPVTKCVFDSEEYIVFGVKYQHGDKDKSVSLFLFQSDGK